MKKLFQKSLALLLAALMIISLAPMSVFALGSATSSTTPLVVDMLNGSISATELYNIFKGANMFDAAPEEGVKTENNVFVTKDYPWGGDFRYSTQIPSVVGTATELKASSTSTSLTAGTLHYAWRRTGVGTGRAGIYAGTYEGPQYFVPVVCYDIVLDFASDMGGVTVSETTVAGTTIPGGTYTYANGDDGKTVRVYAGQVVTPTAVDSYTANITSYTPSTSETLTVSYSQAKGNITIGEIDGFSLSTEIAGEYAAGTPITFTVTPNPVDGNVGYYVESIKVNNFSDSVLRDTVTLYSTTDKNRNSQTVTITVEDSITHEVVITIGTQELSYSNTDAQIKVPYNFAVTTAQQANGGTAYADVANQWCLERAIFEVLGVGYFPDGIQWNTTGVTYQYDPWYQGKASGKYDQDGDPVALTAAPNNRTLYTEYAFGASGKEETVIISYNGLSVSANITLVDGRMTQAVDIDLGNTSETAYEYSNTAALQAEAEQNARVTAGTGTITSVALKSGTGVLDTPQPFVYTITVTGNTEYQPATLEETVWVTLKAVPADITLDIQDVVDGQATGTVSIGSGDDWTGYTEDTSDIALVSGTYTIEVSAQVEDCYVKSVIIKQGDTEVVQSYVGDATSFWTDTVYSAQFTVENEKAYTVTVVYDKIVLAPTAGEILLNDYSNMQDYQSQDIKQKVLVAAGLLGEGMPTADQYTVEINAAGGYHDVESTSYTDTYAIKLALIDDNFPTNRTFQIVLNSDGQRPEVVRQVSMTLVEIRAATELVAKDVTLYVTSAEEVTVEAVKNAMVNAGAGVTVTDTYNTGVTEVDFSNVTLEGYTAELPVSSATYTVTLGLAGSATWQAASNAPTATVTVVNKTLQFHSASLTIENGISVNFKAKKFLFEDPIGYTDPVATFVINGLTFTAPGVLVGEDYVFTLYNIRPDWMGKTIQATLTATLDSEAVTSAIKEYSIKQYCTNQLAKTENAALRTLLVDLMNYGAAAQTYTGDVSDSYPLVNAELTDEQKAFGSTGDVTCSFIQSVGTLENASVTWKRVALFLRETTRLYFQVNTEYTGALTVKYTINGGAEQTVSVEADKLQTGVYGFFFDELTAMQMRDTLVLTVCDEQGNALSAPLTYSIQTYAYNAINATTPEDNLPELMTAMIRYGDAATAYGNS